jgi:hypothetical protein
LKKLVLKLSFEIDLASQQNKYCIGSMGDSSYRLNFDQGKKNEIQHHSQKERLRMSKTAKIGC